MLERPHRYASHRCLGDGGVAMAYVLPLAFVLQIDPDSFYNDSNGDQYESTH